MRPFPLSFTAFRLQRPGRSTTDARRIAMIRVTRCRDARSVRPLCQKLQHRSFNGDGRTDRASLQRATRPGRSTTDARPSVPTHRYSSRSNF